MTLFDEAVNYLLILCALIYHLFKLFELRAAVLKKAHFIDAQA
jgi:hypothetical protein